MLAIGRAPMARPKLLMLDETAGTAMVLLGHHARMTERIDQSRTVARAMPTTGSAGTLSQRSARNKERMTGSDALIHFRDVNSARRGGAE